MKIDGRGAKTTTLVDRACKAVSLLKSSAVIMGIEAVVFEIFIECLHADPLVPVCSTPHTFVGTSEILCLVFLQKRLFMKYGKGNSAI
jgi:hypothetical protein